MSSRSDILSKIKANKPASLELIQIDQSLFQEELDVVDQFKKMVAAVGGHVEMLTSEKDLIPQIKKLFPESKMNYSTIKNTEAYNTISFDTIKKPQELEALDVLVLEGKFGVAENGAIWIPNEQFPIRVAPFICKHLVMLIKTSKILPNMHEAYDELEGQNFDFGLFLSGPSKTADIEQSLVIGAQGALSLTVFLK